MTLQNIEKLSFVENNASNCLVTNIKQIDPKMPDFNFVGDEIERP